MSIEIQGPELERRVREGIRMGRFHDLDELLTKALDASESPAHQMAALDWSRCPAVESVPGRLNGAWVFKDTRMPVSAVFENLEDGATVDEIAEWYRISKEQVVAVLEFATRSVATPAHPSPPMLILFDHSTPAPLLSYLTGYTVVLAKDRGWDRLSNGELLAEAERAGFEVFVSADNSIE